MHKFCLAFIFLIEICTAYAQTANENKVQESIQKENSIRNESDILSAASGIDELVILSGKLLDSDKKFAAKSDGYKLDQYSGMYNRPGTGQQAFLGAKNIRGDEQNFHLYIGTYPIRYMTKPEKMDINGIVGFLTGKTMINITATKMQQKRYYFGDLWLNEWESTDDNWKPTWDGFEGDIAFRFSSERFSETGSFSYMGPRIGYAKKTLSAVKTDVTDRNENVTSQTFNPVDEQIQLMFEVGAMAYTRSIGIDLNIAFGTYYGSFGTGNPDFILEENHYSNQLLENEMAKRWGPILKFNFSIGFML